MITDQTLSLPHLDLDQECCQHKSQGASVDDENESSDHEPSEDPSDDPVLPPGRKPTESLIQSVRWFVLSNGLADVPDGGPVICVTRLRDLLGLTIRGLLLLHHSPPQLRVSHYL